MPRTRTAPSCRWSHCSCNRLLLRTESVEFMVVVLPEHRESTPVAVVEEPDAHLRAHVRLRQTQAPQVQCGKSALTITICTQDSTCSHLQLAHVLQKAQTSVSQQPVLRVLVLVDFLLQVVTRPASRSAGRPNCTAQTTTHVYYSLLLLLTSY